MIKYFLLLVGVATSAEGSKRIMGGSEAQYGQFPYQVLVTCDSTSFCGGVLITLQHALTYETCTYAHLSCSVTVGALTLSGYGEEPGRITRKAITTHDPFSYLMMLIMEAPVDESPYVKPIRLPTTVDVSNMFVDAQGTIAGWGETEAWGEMSDILRFLDVRVIDNSGCGLSPMFMCAVSLSSGKECLRDFGGGLAIHRDGEPLLIGVMHSSDCSIPNYSVYMRITESLDWISQHTGLIIP